jgi:hypothetical protein
MKMRPKPSVTHRGVVTLRVARILRDVVHFLAGEKRAVTFPLLAIF